MKYEKFALLSPPRPEKAVPSTTLGVYERLNWIAQFKKNGTYSVIYVSPDKKVIYKNRHLEDHKAWSPNKETNEVFQSLPGKGWTVLCAELLHSKVPGIRDVHYLHDVLVADGDWLIGKTYMQRYQILQSLFLKNALSSNHSHWVMSAGIWLAKNHKSDFKALFDSIDSPEDEGLVLKDPNSVLGAKDNRWAVKCRYPHKNFNF